MIDIHPKNSVRAVALELKLELRTVQRWYKAWKGSKENALFKPLGRPRITEPEEKLAEDTKSFVTEYNKEYASAAMNQLMKELTENFANLKLSKATLHRYMAGFWELLKRLRWSQLNATVQQRFKHEWTGSKKGTTLKWITWPTVYSLMKLPFM